MALPCLFKDVPLSGLFVDFGTLSRLAVAFLRLWCDAEPIGVFLPLCCEGVGLRQTMRSKIGSRQAVSLPIPDF